MMSEWILQYFAYFGALAASELLTKSVIPDK